MKVLFATDGIFPHAVGGMQRHSRLLIESLARTGEVELTVIHPHQEEQVFDPELGITEISVSPLPGKRNYLLELHEYSKTVAAILDQHPDHLIYSQGLSVWHKVETYGPRLIINPHGLEPYQGLTRVDRLKGWPYRRIYARLFNQAAYTVSLGGSLTGILEGTIRDKKRITVLPNATLLPEGDWKKWAKARTASPIKVLFVGRFAANKGIDRLLQAIEQLNQEGLSEAFHFSLAGKGPLYEEMKARYSLPNADLLGFVSDEQLADLYQTHHLFLLPTLFEGMPTVVLEGMAHGQAILVTDVGATLELVDASNGFIIEKGSHQSIVQYLKQYLALSSADKQKLGETSRAKVEEQFTWEQVAQRTLEHLQHMQVEQGAMVG